MLTASVLRAAPAPHRRARLIHTAPRAHRPDLRWVSVICACSVTHRGVDPSSVPITRSTSRSAERMATLKCVGHPTGRAEVDVEPRCAGLLATSAANMPRCGWPLLAMPDIGSTHLGDRRARRRHRQPASGSCRDSRSAEASGGSMPRITALERRPACAGKRLAPSC
jgi:hypothetical protein